MVWPGWLGSCPEKYLFSPAFSQWRFTLLRSRGLATSCSRTPPCWPCEGIPVCRMLPDSLPGLHYSQFQSGWFLRLTIFVCKTGRMLACPNLGRSHCSDMRGHLRGLRLEFLKVQI